MLYVLLVAALAVMTAAAPMPQGIEIPDAVAAADPVLFTPPLDVESDTPTEVAPAPIDPITTPVSKVKREATLVERDGSCAVQPAGSGPIPTPDTAAAFSADPDLQAFSTNAPTPDGYVESFQGATGSLSASNYMGLYTLNSYDTLTCASQCDKASGCQAFNVYIERDPSLDPNAANCPNPPSTTNFKCTLWGAPVSSAEATNQGQWRDSFQVVITGSNGYNKDSPPSPINGFTGPQELGGAINAPLDQNGHNTYMGYQFFPFSQSQGYDPSTCAQACNVQTAYNSRHPNADGSYQTCTFFNAYVLSEDSVPQGLYCSLYNETWAPSYATNYGQYRGSDRYTVSRSYSYTLNTVTTTTSSVNPISSTSSTTSSTSTSSTTTSSTTTTTSSTTTYAPGCTPTPTNLVQNGGFECGGLNFWNATDVVNSYHTLSFLGDNSDNAFEFYQDGPNSADELANPASLTQQISGLVVGASYTVSFNLWFDKCTQTEGFVGVRFPGYPGSGSWTFDACDDGQAAVQKYGYTSFVMTAEATTEQLRFDFEVDTPNAEILLDNIAITLV